MCGIVGYQGFHDLDLIQEMLAKVAHRGPDGEGIWVSKENEAGLGHRRLAIMDLSDQGKQPMPNEDGSILLVVNGEIYNYLKLKKELISRGHEFKSTSDSEVLVHLYEEYGTHMLGRLNGIFAFAIWDDKNKTLFCGRDPMGVKPLYYVEDN